MPLLLGLLELAQLGVAAFDRGVETLLGGLVAGPDRFQLLVDDVANLDEIAEAEALGVRPSAAGSC